MFMIMFLYVLKNSDYCLVKVIYIVRTMCSFLIPLTTYILSN